MNSPRYRNLGISAHIEAGRTTLTERIIEITGQIMREQEMKEQAIPKGPTIGEMIAEQIIEKNLK